MTTPQGDAKVEGGNNIALACVEAGHYVGTGFIIAACIQAETMPIGIILFLAAEVLVILYSFIYEAATAYDDRKAIKDDRNAAAAIIHSSPPESVHTASFLE